MTGPGRPTLYTPEHASRARELCARGATNSDLAGRFGVARSTIGQWLSVHPEFAEAVQQGRGVADATAVESLFTRVTGYNHKVEKILFQRRAPDSDLHRACSTRNQGLHVLAAQQAARGVAGDQRARGGRDRPEGRGRCGPAGRDGRSPRTAAPFPRTRRGTCRGFQCMTPRFRNRPNEVGEVPRRGGGVMFRAAAHDPLGSLASRLWCRHQRIKLLSPARGRGWVRGIPTSFPPHLASPPSGGEELELRPPRGGFAGEEQGLRYFESMVWRTLKARWSMVNGLGRNAVPTSTMPLCTTALRVYPVV
jgi:hypothetical protein